MTVLTAGLAFVVLWLIELLRGTSDDAGTYERAIARKRKSYTASTDPNSDDVMNEETLDSGVVIRLGDDGELIYENAKSEQVPPDKHL
jgi:hypothetical protein